MEETVLKELIKEMELRVVAFEKNTEYLGSKLPTHAKAMGWALHDR